MKEFKSVAYSKWIMKKLVLNSSSKKGVSSSLILLNFLIESRISKDWILI